MNFGYKSFDLDFDLYYVHGGVQRYNYTYVRNRDSANKNAVSGQTGKMWFRQGDENKTYWTPYYTSSTAEESAAASEELSSQAALLKELVGQFRLREEM